MARPVSARLFRGTPRNVALLARKLREGELVAVPTETVYGLGANALSARACRRIFQAKGRPSTDPLIVHLWSTREMASVCVPNPSALALAAAFWPGPLTLVLPKTASVPAIVTAGLDSVAVRVPSHPLFRRLLQRAGIPVAAPSANPFGYVSPTTAQHVEHGLGRQIRYILDGGPTTIGVESTILDLREERRPCLLRPGAITRDQIEAVLGRSVRVKKRPAARSGAQIAPGMLTRHYSPRTPVVLRRRLRVSVATKTPQEAFVFLQKPTGRYPSNVFWLDETGDLKGIARQLFAILRRLDQAGFARIQIELAPGKGLADAINDRLRRAAAR